ncbi:MAG: DMT family transporter [Bdellovibrionaceae bacterium]|nr:DMT family transporter [Pseudobdellovibrionaceae bacterium]MBX3034425.1 DMT family transporter [Pseudobdellovibrionaceae bacterium]
MSPHRRGLLQVAIASVCFGLIGIFGKKIYEAGLSVGELLSLRFTIATIVLGAALLLSRPRVLRLSRRQWVISSLLGLLGYAVFSTLYFLSIQGVSAALAVLLLYTFPFWTVLINFFLGQRLTGKQMGALLGASAGLALLLWGQLEVRTLMAVAAGIGSAIAYAAFIVISGRWTKGVHPLGSGFWIIAAATVGLLLFHRPDPAQAMHWDFRVWALLLGIAVIGTVIPLTLIQAGLQKLSSTETALLSMIEPVTAAAASTLVLGESLSPRQMLGGVVVLGCLILVNRRVQPAG